MPEAGNLIIDGDGIVYTLGEHTAEFSPVDTMDFQKFQLCQEGKKDSQFQ